MRKWSRGFLRESSDVVVVGRKFLSLGINALGIIASNGDRMGVASDAPADGSRACGRRPRPRSDWPTDVPALPVVVFWTTGSPAFAISPIADDLTTARLLGAGAITVASATLPR